MFGFGFPPEPRGNFKSTFRAYSVSMMPGQERQDVDRGGKIIMPPSALDTLTRLNIQYPMLFKLKNDRTKRETHCGVLEFVADEGRVYLPYWMMNNLTLEEGDLVHLENVSLSVASFAKFQPQSPDFLDISNPKAVLENALRTFACLTKGDVVCIKYNEKEYELCVLETKPRDAVSIIECDMNVDFAPPVGYQEPWKEEMKKKEQEEDEEEDMAVDVTEYLEKNSWHAFSGQGNRLDGKQKNTQSSAEIKPNEYKRGIPNYEFKKGFITFIRAARGQNGTDQKNDDESFEAFSGSGQSLRKKGTRK